MSFKREGNDGSQLNVLKKRRVADLLASYIPKDEALLIKNGRYACTVCHHRPVFDTIDMLTVHRSGKKHISCLQRHYGKKLNHRNEIQKRQHQEYVRAEEAGEQLPKGPAPLLAQTRKITQNALLKAAPYNSCCSRKRPDAGKKMSSSEIPPSSAPIAITESSHPVTSWPVPPESTAGVSHSEPTGSFSGVSKPSAVQKHSGRRKKRKSSGKGEEPGDDPDRRREMQHYLLLKSSGWIPDGTGKWVKDESVEFDSDEDEPPAVPPP
ncbi:sodium channel modifier 1 [Pseudophryne corroboree]|uniref:sodium channel modifier 1 n=1 Tax=Pseudophryne corroboree TaxID=495146 RepID=UPI0030815D5E